MIVEALADGLYSVELWYNYGEIDIFYFLDAFLQSISDAVINCLEVIAVGKETIFSYNSNFIQMEKETHNIEIWVVPETKVCKESEKNLGKYNITKSIIKGKNMVIMVLKKS